MSHYKSNVRDLEFNLFEVFGVGQVLDERRLRRPGRRHRRDILREVRRLAEDPLAESFADADRNPPVFDPRPTRATLPESFKKSYRAMQDGGWDKLGLPEELGGTRRAARRCCWAHQRA